MAAVEFECDCRVETIDNLHARQMRLGIPIETSGVHSSDGVRVTDNLDGCCWLCIAIGVHDVES